MSATASRWAWGVARLAVGLGIVAFLLHKIHAGTVAVTFRVEPAGAVGAGAVYAAGPDGAARFLVLRDSAAGDALATRQTAKGPGPIPAEGDLRLAAGNGPGTLRWTSRTVVPCGLPVLGESFAAAWTHWPALVLAAICVLLCLIFSVVRWRMILTAQGLELPWGKAWAIVFIGQFFNSFMFGATGGDVVKAYYAARETGHRKTEAVSTVFIDRVVGLMGLIVLTTSVMAARVRFFLADARTRYALLFMGAVAAVTVAALIAMYAARGLSRLVPAATRLLATRPGAIFHRAYRSFYLVLTHPALLAATLAISMANHFLLIVSMWAIGYALGMAIPFADYLSLGPAVNAIAAIPITPGGLGVRESAMVVYMSVVNVPATQALPLSLLGYAIALLWSLAGGLVFMMYRGGSAESLGEELAHAGRNDP